MRKARTLVSLAALVGTSLGAGSAAAQVDVNPPLPNVMLLVDSSGSMEYKSSSAAFPSCDPTGPGSEKSRWVELLEVLTGTIQDYRCDSVNRGSAAFKNEYSLSGVLPPDADYLNPYHRPLSGTCTPGPGVLPINAYDYPAGAVKYHVYNNTSTTCATFAQASDGLLDSFGSAVRFGLMTFDPHTGGGTGVSGTSPDYNTGVSGTWSYFLNAQPKQGKPAACSTMSAQEVGARNAAAPPWEGRMVGFGASSASGATLATKNAQIQEILLASRPYGATPIAGMLEDTRDFLWNDTSLDPLISTDDFGPYRDPFINGGCRQNFVVLLSDGEPNLDLRPFCEGLGPPVGVCPYAKPEDIAFDLANAADPNKRTKVFVIGFAVSNVTLQNSTPVDCENLTDADLNNPTGLCATNPNERELQACCTLSRIAYNGGTTRAYFADDKDELRASLSAVLSSIVKNTTSRTIPVFASSPTISDPFAAGYRFFSSFETKQFQLWNGVIERQRYVCKKDSVTGELTPEPQDIDSTKGDDFVANVNSGSGPPRKFYTVQGNLDVGKIHSQRSIRPGLTGNPDGISNYSGSEVSGDASGLAGSVLPAAMGLDGTSCPAMTAAQCRDKYLRWVLGLNNGTIYHRCATPGATDCNLVGDIFHSTPNIVGPPAALLRDETYELFASSRAKRPIVMYTSTNDGFLHAFKVAAVDPADSFKVDAMQNNELWAFVPPAVLPSFPSQYPGTHQVLLDGLPVIKDVVAQTGVSGLVFERSPGQASSGQGQWRTILLQGFGGGRGGYFALDVTDPAAGPKFLWQLTEDESGAPLFGNNSSTPVISTLFFDTGGGVVKEVAVAVLPGGDAVPTGGPCARRDPVPTGVDTRFTPRSNVPCYGAAVPARSLTVVRLDNGEVIRSFRGELTDAPANLSAAGRVIHAPIDSPITGTPVPFPATTGAIADRIFVGDRDGTLWRVDVSSTNPSNWTMKLFFDTYATTLGHDWDEGHAIETPPILSVDDLGNITLAISTGDQDVLTATPGMATYAFSLTEKVVTVGPVFTSNANWYTRFDDGERVAGPMTLFNGSLFFSTFAPEPPGSAQVCKAGSSRVWGVDYIKPKQIGSALGDLSKGGLERLPDSGSLVQFIDSSSTLLQDGSVIFGVGVTQLPSCTEEASVTDPYFGSGTHTSISNIAPGNFQLVMHTGGIGQTVVGGKSRRLEINLPTPRSTTNIDSWAAIIE
ncbi:MAG: PilC/PilY family type IV pilus protein [Polyangiaceae bacterium]